MDVLDAVFPHPDRAILFLIRLENGIALLGQCPGAQAKHKNSSGNLHIPRKIQMRDCSKSLTVRRARRAAACGTLRDRSSSDPSSCLAYDPASKRSADPVYKSSTRRPPLLRLSI